MAGEKAAQGVRKHAQKRKPPLRTCIGCRTVRDKREMLRIVRLPEGGLALDEKGKRSGRGAYVCASPECLRAALHGGRLARALQVEVPESLKQALEKELSAHIATRARGRVEG